MTQLAQRTLGETVTVRYELAEDLPNCELDPTQLEVAILNILVNARDAMPDGGTILVETGTADVVEENWKAHPGLRPGRYVTLAIADTGTGIPPSVLDRVMDPFFTTKDDGKGTGLGLSMVYGFAKQSRGTATIESQVDVGTRVRLYFPAAGAVGRGPDGPVLRVGDRGGSETVLIVDDREDVAELARDMLESLGYTVQVATSARAALDLAGRLQADERPALLFSDVVMPGGMNGYALAREMRRIVPQISVLLTTGFDRDMGRLDAAGADEFEVLKKPYRLSDLARRVRTLLDGATGSRAN
jgi:CheY-like chemotaxis protein